MHPFVLDLLVGAREHTLAVLAGKARLLLVSTTATVLGTFGGIRIARLLVNFKVHVVVDGVVELAVTNATHKLFGGLLVHLLVHRQEVLVEAGGERTNEWLR